MIFVSKDKIVFEGKSASFESRAVQFMELLSDNPKFEVVIVGESGRIIQRAELYPFENESAKILAAHALDKYMKVKRNSKNKLKKL